MRRVAIERGFHDFNAGRVFLHFSAHLFHRCQQGLEVAQQGIAEWRIAIKAQRMGKAIGRRQRHPGRIRQLIDAHGRGPEGIGQHIVGDLAMRLRQIRIQLAQHQRYRAAALQGCVFRMMHVSCR